MVYDLGGGQVKVVKIYRTVPWGAKILKVLLVVGFYSPNSI